MQQLSAFGQKQQRITETQTLINKNSNVFTLSENQSVIQILQGYDPDNKIQDPSFIDQNNIMIIEVENSQLNKSQAQLFDEIEAKNQTEMLENDKSNISLTSTNQTIVIDHDDKNSPEQLGLIVKQVIEQAKPCSTIILPNTHFKIGSLLIDKPLILKGRSGTILEMTHGSIQVNFGEQEKYKEVFVFCECHIVLSDRADLITIRDEIENDSEKAINRNQFIYASNSKQNGKNENFENSPKNAKLQNDVHLRHEIKVHSPPSEKDDQYQETQQKQKIKDQSHKQTNRALESYDIENYDKLNMSCGGEPNLSQNQFVSNSEISSSIIPLFVVKNYTYVEIRDCLISSKNKQGAMDVAFVLNEKDENEQNQQYKGILSIKSCNIVGFSLGFLAGSNSILSVEIDNEEIKLDYLKIVVHEFNKLWPNKLKGDYKKECEFYKNKQSGIYIFDTGAVKDTKSSTQAKELKISTNGQILNQGLSNITDPILSPTLSNNGVTRGLPMLSMHTPRVENRTRNSNQEKELQLDDFKLQQTEVGQIKILKYSDEELRAHFDNQSMLQSYLNSPDKHNPNAQLMQQQQLTYNPTQFLINHHSSATWQLVKFNLKLEQGIWKHRLIEQLQYARLCYEQNGGIKQQQFQVVTFRLSNLNLQTYQIQKAFIRGKVGGDWGEFPDFYKELQSNKSKKSHKILNQNPDSNHSEFHEQSDLSRMIQEVNKFDIPQEYFNSKPFDVKQNISSKNEKMQIMKIQTTSEKKQPKKQSGILCALKCFSSKKEKRRIEQYGDYLIIKEISKRALREQKLMMQKLYQYQQKSNHQQQNKKTCLNFMLKCCSCQFIKQQQNQTQQSNDVSKIQEEKKLSKQVQTRIITSSNFKTTKGFTFETEQALNIKDVQQKDHPNIQNINNSQELQDNDIDAAIVYDNEENLNILETKRGEYIEGNEQEVQLINNLQKEQNSLIIDKNQVKRMRDNTSVNLNKVQNLEETTGQQNKVQNIETKNKEQKCLIF
eukprot:403350264